MENFISASNNRKKSLKLVLILISSFFVVQILVGLKIGSLAVISEAGHMLIDVAGLVMALLAISFAQRPATQIRTYGFYRAEILASLLNSIFLILLAVFILAEAFQRIIHPSEVNGFSMIIIASIGLGINLLAIRILGRAHLENRMEQQDGPKKYAARLEDDLNLHGAYLEVLADTVGSAGVIVAGIIIQTTGFYIADALISIGIVALILPRIWLLLKKALHILIEGTPAHLCHEEIKQAIQRIRGVTGVFDLHIWTISSGIHSLSAHVVVIDTNRASSVLQEINSILENDYDITHATIQVEPYHESTNI